MNPHTRTTGPLKQRGVVLFISLIVLVAMTLAGIAVTRSVDTGNLISGNVAFKQGTIVSADRGIQAALGWLMSGSNFGNLRTDDLSNGYYSANASITDWTDSTIWDSAVTVPDAAGHSSDISGNTVSYVIHRMCLQPSADPNDNCAQTSEASSAAQGSSMRAGMTPAKPLPAYYYRISVRVQGPRETLSVVQASVQIK